MSSLYWRHDRSGAAALYRHRPRHPRVRELRLFSRDGTSRLRHRRHAVQAANKHARQSRFLLHCRKLADLFQNKLGPEKDDILAENYLPGFCAALPVSTKWRIPMNKQLAHVTYARDTSAREIDRSACEALYKELKDIWREFRKGLVGGLYEAEFENQVRKRKEPHANGQLSEFRFYDLD